MKFYLYNERQSRNGKTTLTPGNLVRTLDVHGVGISLPRGSVKLNVSEYITHMRFTYHGIEWIVKVLQRTNRGNDLYDIEYEIDYLKDYWNKYAGNAGHYRIARTTNSSLANKLIPDPSYSFNGDTGYNINTTQGLAFSPFYNFVVVLSGGASSYSTGNYDVKSRPLQAYILSADSFAKFTYNITFLIDAVASIKHMYMLPVTEGELHGATIYGSSNMWYQTVDWREGIIFPGTADVVARDMTKPDRGDIFSTKVVAHRITADGGSVGCYFEKDTGITIPKPTNFIERTKRYSLYVPYIGNVEVDPIRTNGRIKVQYKVNPYTGTMAAMLNNDPSTLTGAVPLPAIPFATSNAQLQIQRIEAQDEMAQFNAATSIVGAGIFGGAAAAPSILSSAAGAFGSHFIGAENAKELATIGSMSVIGGVNGDSGIFNNQFTLVTATPGETMSYASHATANGYISNEYVNTLSGLPAGYDYWLDFSNALVYGNDAYADAVRQAYNNVRISVV